MDIFTIILGIVVTTFQVNCTHYNVKTNDSFTLSPAEIPTVAERMACALKCHQASCGAFVVNGNDRMCKFVQPTSNPYGDLYISEDIKMCHLLPTGTPSGVYTITPSDLVTTDVSCDMDTLGGGWTVIQNRFDGSQRFDKNWDKYKWGFGSPYGEYWIGNENLYLLTSSGAYELRIEVEDYSRVSKYASYMTFVIASERENYQLTISRYTGNVLFDAMSAHNLKPFSTADKDNDASVANCAMTYRGGWWYDDCHRVNLNGHYNTSVAHDATVMSWFSLVSIKYDVLSSSKMMIRPV